MKIQFEGEYIEDVVGQVLDFLDSYFDLPPDEQCDCHVQENAGCSSPTCLGGLDDVCKDCRDAETGSGQQSAVGHYWVRLYGAEDFTVAYYNGQGLYFLQGIECSFPADSFVEIGDRVQ